jgi:glycosyltransferase involved in cell wall biosynthesis
MALNALGWRTETRTTLGAFTMALRQFPRALRSRRRALLRARISDSELFQRVRPSVFRETLLAPPGSEPEPSPRRRSDSAEYPPSVATAHRRLNILFVSPYSVYPPLHGGAVFMLQAIRELSKRHDIYLLTFVDRAEEAAGNRSLEGIVRKVEVRVRQHRRTLPFHLASNAERTFYDPDFAALLDKMVLLHEIDLIQFEYTQLAQYRLPLHRVPQCLFEHDLYFRSVQRQLWTGQGTLLVKARELLEWLRAIRYEVAAARQFDAVFTCNEEEQRILESFLKTNGVSKVRSGLRTAVDVASYRYPGGRRLPDSLLFVGNFQHRPNTEGLQVFCDTILPLIRARRPGATLYIAGANAPPEWEHRFASDGIRLVGQVQDIREPLSAYSVFVCPIWLGAGVRVKILEAFASGIPVVSTSLGAEGLAVTAGADLLLGDTPAAFADACLALLEQPGRAEALAARARRLVETRYDWPVVAGQLDEVYQELVAPAARPVEVSHAGGIIAR